MSRDGIWWLDQNGMGDVVEVCQFVCFVEFLTCHRGNDDCYELGPNTTETIIMHSASWIGAFRLPYTLGNNALN